MNPCPPLVRRTVRTVALALLLAACSGAEPAGAVPGTTSGTTAGTTAGTTPSAARSATLTSALTSAPAAAVVTPPPANGRFDYQIGGGYAPAAGVTIVDRDRTEDPAAGRYGICYVNAFQTQPGELAWWQAHHPDLLLRDAAGRLVVDSAWNEVLLDLRTAAKRSTLAAVVGGWVDGCAARGYRGVEFDNLDSWTRSRNLMTYPQARAFAVLIAARAHRAGLAAAQKNTVDRSADLKAAAGFDFAIVEECQVYAECDAATSVYGAQVYEVEYPDNGGPANFSRACSARGARISVVYRDRDVVPRGSPGYVYRWC